MNYYSNFSSREIRKNFNSISNNFKEMEKTFDVMEENLFRFEKLFQIINLIDRAIKFVDNSIEEVLRSVCSELIILSESNHIELYFFSKNECLRMGFSKRILNSIEVQNLFDDKKEELKSGKPQFRKIGEGSENSNRVIIPILVREKLFAAIILEDDKTKNEETFLNKEEFQNLFIMISNQLGIYIDRFLSKSRREFQDSLLKTFFSEHLKPSACWAAIVKNIVTVLPIWGPFHISEPPKVQLLLYESGDKYLTIGATQGKEPQNTFLLVDESVCGLIINDKKNKVEKEKEFLYVDPHDYPNLYRGFLYPGLEEKPHSELVVPILYEKEIIGVINVEHLEKCVFKKLHIETIIEVSNFLAPFLKALKEKFQSQKNKEIALLYVMSNLLYKAGSIYSHLIGQPILEMRMELENITDIENITSSRLNQHIKNLYAFIDKISLSSDRFTESLPEFIKKGEINLNLLLEKTLDGFNIDTFRESEGIDIQYENNFKEVSIYASMLFQEHLYNLINNSIEAIQEKNRNSLTNFGNINLSVFKKQVSDLFGMPTATTFIMIRVEDNGGGVDDINKFKIGQPKFTTKRHGHGFGLRAALDYVESVGGYSEHYNNDIGGYTIDLYLQTYSPVIHANKF